MNEEIKRCPYRQDENGNFLTCYGPECMAYLEYSQPVISITPCNSMKEPPIRVIACKRMMQMPYCGGGCN